MADQGTNNSRPAVAGDISHDAPAAAGALPPDYEPAAANAQPSKVLMSEKDVTPISSTKGAWTRMREGGWQGIKDNFTPSKSGGGKVAFRSCGVLAGGALALHSLKSQNAEGEDRSTAVRLGEGALGLLVMAGAAAYPGAARV